MARITVIRGGLVLDAGAHMAPAMDILIDDDTILEIGPPGLAAPADAAVIDAVKEQILAIDDVVRGTLLRRTKVCGKAWCRCATRTCP